MSCPNLQTVDVDSVTSGAEVMEMFILGEMSHNTLQEVEKKMYILNDKWPTSLLH